MITLLFQVKDFADWWRIGGAHIRTDIYAKRNGAVVSAESQVAEAATLAAVAASVAVVELRRCARQQPRVTAH